MPRSLLIVSGAALATTAGATEYWPCATGPTGRSTNEAEKRLSYRYAGTFSKLYVRVTANTTSLQSTVRLRKNATSVNLQVPIPLSTSGVYEDITNTDTIASADLMAIQTISGGTGTLTISILSIYFEALTECVTKLATQTQVTPITFSIASTSKFNFLAGNYADIGSDSGCQHRIAKDGTIKNMSVYVSANARITDTIVKSRKNGVDGNLLITITPSFTGLLEDITHSDTVVEGDLVNNTTVFGTGTQSISFWSLSADYVAGSNQRFTMLDTGNVIIPGLSTTLYIALAGGFVSTNTVENSVKVKARGIITLSNMSIQILANSITAESTLRLRKNGAAGNLYIPIPLSTSGTFTDVVNSDVLSATDEANYQLITGGTGTTLQLRGIQANAAISQDITKTLTDSDPAISETRARQKAAWRLQP